MTTRVGGALLAMIGVGVAVEASADERSQRVAGVLLVVIGLVALVLPDRA